MKPIKCVVVGDGAVGKTSLVLTYITGDFPGERVPKVSANYSRNVIVEDQRISVQLWEPPRQEDYTEVRQQAYPQTDVFVLCFSLVSPTSLNNVRYMWVPEVRECCPNTPYILVGLRSDMRDEFPQHVDEYRSKGFEPVQASQGEGTTKEIKAQAYVECSAKIQYNLQQVFETAIKVVLHPPPPPATVEEAEEGDGDEGDGDEGDGSAISPFATLMKDIKCVVVGDAAVGKTCLLFTSTRDEFPGEYIPTVFDNYDRNVMVEDQQIKLHLWDTAGQKDYKNLRPLSYQGADVFLFCFSLVDPTSLENVKNTWLPEIQEHCPNTPYILVGLKSDLRDEFAQHEDEYKSRGWEPVQASQVEDMKNAVNAQAYLECSAKIRYNLGEVFEAAVKVVLHQPPPAPATVEEAAGGDGEVE